jgi:hypothetical protein
MMPFMVIDIGRKKSTGISQTNQKFCIPVQSLLLARLSSMPFLLYENEQRKLI